MENKGKIKRGIEHLQSVKTWQLIVVILILSFVAATFLRLNNIGMVQRREAVIVADEQGDAQKIHERLYELQHYVSSHMNTDLGPGVPLNASYSRDYQKWQEAVYGSASPGENIYKKAQEICAPRFSSYSQAYLECTTNELSKYPPSESSVDESAAPRPETYIHSFSSPIWSADFAGWSVLLVAAVASLVVVRFIAYLVLRLMLNRHYKRV